MIDLTKYVLKEMGMDQYVLWNCVEGHVIHDSLDVSRIETETGFVMPSGMDAEEPCLILDSLGCTVDLK